MMTGITSCIDKYWPNVDKYEHVLVVDGLLNNGDNPVLVKLSYSSSINTQLVEPVTGAELYITDEQQMETPLIESEPGTYVAADSTFRGVVGKSYQLHIHTNGQEYVSNLCNLPAPSPIDSIYSIRETHASDVYNETVYGIQFYIDNHSDYINDTSYYIWRLTETYKYMAAFLSTIFGKVNLFHTQIPTLFALVGKRLLLRRFIFNQQNIMIYLC
jgi:hypothetical protein